MGVDESVVEIDKYALDEECANHPREKLKYGILLADARRDEAAMKNHLKIVEAEVDRDVRLNPEAFGITKVVEKAVEGAVLLARKVVEAKNKLIDATHKVGVLESYIYALSDRKSMLEKEVDLFLSGYFSAPRTNRRHEEENMNRAFGPRKPK